MTVLLGGISTNRIVGAKGMQKVRLLIRMAKMPPKKIWPHYSPTVNVLECFSFVPTPVDF